jgi:hypothetical protein
MQILGVTVLLTCLLFTLNLASDVGTPTTNKSPAKRGKPIKLVGWMETGKTYRAEVVYQGKADTGMWWPVGLRIPYHHAVNVSWQNIDDFARVKRSQTEGRRLVFTFKVLSKDIWKVPDKWQWRTRYECRIISVAEARGD